LRTLQVAFAATGGMLAADTVAALMRPAVSQPISLLARWIVDRQVISVRSPTQTLLPMFQFHPGLTALRPGLAAILEQLAPLFDDWELVNWFAQANSSLSCERPADVLGRDPRAVYEAARFDRFIVGG
jgi:hypothetical protein